MMGAVLVAAGLMMSACAAPASPQDTTAPIVTSAPSAAPQPTPDEVTPLGPVETFLAWIDASRAPDAEKACAGISEELAARMIAELNSSGPFQVSTCDEMITATAELYRATGQSAEVEVSVQEQSESDATLFVTYDDSGDCGTVVMTRSATGWIITEQSEECAV